MTKSTSTTGAASSNSSPLAKNEPNPPALAPKEVAALLKAVDVGQALHPAGAGLDAERGVISQPQKGGGGTGDLTVSHGIIIVGGKSRLR